MVETLLATGKRETAIDSHHQQQQQQPQAASGMSESSDTAAVAKRRSSRDIDASSSSSTNTAAPIATIEGHDDADLKITVDGGDVTTKGKVVTSPPSCTRLDEASQACV